jgi:DNA-binding transcriptional LysR family regulator
LIRREDLLVALPDRHRLVDHPHPLDITDVDGERVVMYSPTDARYFYELLVGAFRSAGVTVRYSQYLSQIHSMLALVKAGLGIALVPAAAAQLRYEGVTFREISLADGYSVELHAAWRADNDNPALAALLELL